MRQKHCACRKNVQSGGKVGDGVRQRRPPLCNHHPLHSTTSDFPIIHTHIGHAHCRRINISNIRSRCFDLKRSPPSFPCLQCFRRSSVSSGPSCGKIAPHALFDRSFLKCTHKTYLACMAVISIPLPRGSGHEVGAVAVLGALIGSLRSEAGSHRPRYLLERNQNK